MTRGQVFAFTPSDRMGESHNMLEALAYWIVLGQAGRHTPNGHNTAVSQRGDTYLTVAAEG